MKTAKQLRDEGVLYDANYDNELLSEMDNSMDKCYEYNSMKPSDKNRDILIRELLGKVGECITIRSPFHCDYGYNIEVGNNFFSNYNLTILDGAKVTFGDNVFIGPNCSFYTAGHPVDAERRNAGLEYAHPITVGDNVWFGGDVKVMPGVTIGNNVVIGAGSVVTRDIPDNCVAVGSPCKVIRNITEKDSKREYNFH